VEDTFNIYTYIYMYTYVYVYIYIYNIDVYIHIYIYACVCTYPYAGSFGISACCSLDRDLVVLACRGQAMSLAFNEIHGVVLWGSEVCVIGQNCRHIIVCVV